jgi:hypothetical protein
MQAALGSYLLFAAVVAAAAALTGREPQKETLLSIQCWYFYQSQEH